MPDELLQNLRNTIRTVPDFPIEGIMFRDITPVLSDPDLMSSIINRFVEDIEGRGWRPDAVVGPEARGFIFGPLLAARLDISFIPIRKPGKLPYEAYSVEYELEYGSNTLEMHVDALGEGQNVVIIDDLLATGGTVSACVELCRRAGANPIGSLFVIELEGLGAHDLLAPLPVHALIKFPA
ncbi:MAG: adenine phosphoribosyltransferase [Candidatus Thalassarchaeum sp.]